MTIPPAEVQPALMAAVAGGDRAALAAALDAYAALAELNGRRADGMGRDFTILRQAAPAMGQALAQQGAAGLALVEELAAHPLADVRCLACLLLGEIGRSRPDEIMPAARRLGADESWVVREFIANALDDGLGPTRGDELFAHMERWISDPDANVRRVPTNALMRYGRHRPERVAGLMGRLLHDPSEYVRKNVAFCLGIVGMARHPTLGVHDPGRPLWLAGMLRQWAADPEERARWIVAETLGRKWTRGCLDEAEALLCALADDESRLVRRQVAASLRAIAGYRTAADA